MFISDEDLTLAEVERDEAQKIVWRTITTPSGETVRTWDYC